jgi:hypothetical protein
MKKLMVKEALFAVSRVKSEMGGAGAPWLGSETPAKGDSIEVTA